MKFSLALALCVASTRSAYASKDISDGSPSSPTPPTNCIGTNLLPITDRDTLKVNDAICRDNARLGINSDGIYGVWNHVHNDNKKGHLIQKFASDVFKVKLTESTDGENVAITAYHKKGEVDPLWKLTCEGLSGQGETKLTVHEESDDNNNIVRLKQGHELQDKLWLVHSNGKSKLDNLCQVTEHHAIEESSSTLGISPGTGEEHSSDGRYKMIVFHQNKKLCMSTNRSEGLREGDRVALASCSPEDESERFILDDRGRIRPRRSPDLCVNVEEATQGEELALADCKVANNNIWLHDKSGKLTPRGGKDYCANYGNGLVGASVALEECNRMTSWDFVDPNEYDAPSSDSDEDKYQASRKFLRWRTLVDAVEYGNEVE